MLGNLFQSKDSLLLVLGQTTLMYLYLIFGMRALGRRQFVQLNPIDLLALLLLGSAVETAMVAGNTSLPAGFVSCATLLFWDRVLNYVLYRNKRFRHWMLGPPLVVVQNGRYVDATMSRINLSQDDIEQAVRKRGFDGISEIRYAVVESNGEIDVVGMHHGSRHG